MNDQHDGNADEAAARAIQAEIWMAEQEDVDAHPEDFMPENDRRLLLERRNELGPELGEDDAQQDNAVGEDDAGDAGDADNLNPEAEAEAETIDGGVAGEVFDDQKVKITRSLKCPLVSSQDAFSLTLHSFYHSRFSRISI